MAQVVSYILEKDPMRLDRLHDACTTHELTKGSLARWSRISIGSMLRSSLGQGREGEGPELDRILAMSNGYR